MICSGDRHDDLAAWRSPPSARATSARARTTRRNIRAGRSTSSSASRRAAATTSSRASFGQKLSESLGQPVIVENKPGGGAIVATEYVATIRARRLHAADRRQRRHGRSIRPSTPSCPTTRCGISSPVSELASFPLILIVNATSPIKSVADLVAYAKANPDKTNYASSSASFQLVDRAVQAEDRRADAGDPLQERQRFGARGDLGPGDHDHRGCRPGDQPGQGRHGPRAGGRRAEADGRVCPMCRP